jgi:type II secretory pathway pseudopilin PulG
MKKWGYWIIGLLLVGLVAGIAVPAVMASRASNPSDEALAAAADEADLAELAAALQEADPLVTDNDEEAAKKIKLLEVTLGGGFQGEWGTDNAEDADPMGSLVGIYGKVKRADKQINYFTGIWLADDGSIFGYLRGTCSDNGTFTGVWRNSETEVGGLLNGTYSPVNNDNVTAGEFNGTWETTDGEQSGYLRGTWSPAVSVEREGRFGGLWVNDDQLAASCQGDRVSAKCKAKNDAECNRASRIWGSYGRINLADNTTIQYFVGKWHAANGRLHGRLGGVAIDGKFYGVWGGQKNGCRAGGYLTGDYSYDSQLEKEPKGTFEGVWGRFGQEDNGQLRGKFSPLPVPQPFEDQEF